MHRHARSNSASNARMSAADRAAHGAYAARGTPTVTGWVPPRIVRVLFVACRPAPDRQLWFTNLVARPREHSDDDLLHSIASGLANASGSWTIAEAARGAGVHPATLVKRFGSKHGVLIALSKRWQAAIPEQPRSDDCLTELHEWIKSTAAPPRERADSVAAITMLVEDLKDAELSKLLSAGWQRQLRYLSALVSGAHADGKLSRSPEPTAAATLLLDIVNGGYLRAAASSEETSTVSTRSLIHELLESWT